MVFINIILFICLFSVFPNTFLVLQLIDIPIFIHSFNKNEGTHLHKQQQQQPEVSLLGIGIPIVVFISFCIIIFYLLRN